MELLLELLQENPDKRPGDRGARDPRPDAIFALWSMVNMNYAYIMWYYVYNMYLYLYIYMYIYIYIHMGSS